jgi:N-acetylmuramoyl-L-alanine amidase
VRRFTRRLSAAVVGAALFVACTGAPGALPPIEQVDGPLRLRVVYPQAGETVPSAGLFTVLGSAGSGRARVSVNGTRARVHPNGSFLVRVPVPHAGAPAFRVESILGRDTARVVLLVRIAAPAGGGSPEAPRASTVERLALLSRAGGPDQRVAARPSPDGAPGWFLLPETLVTVTGERDGFTRVRLDPEQEVWVRSADVHAAPHGATLARRARAPRIVSTPQSVDVVVPLSARPPLLVEEDPDGFVLTLYGTRLGTGGSRTARGNAYTLVHDVSAFSVTDDRVQIRIRTAPEPFGYAVDWEGGAVVLRVRRAPPVRGGTPLVGLTVAVDAGHPPGGATGPTGLQEASVTLAVARQLRRDLEARGARVVLTRDGAGAVELEARVRHARVADAHAMVSVHVDSRPGQTDPYLGAGTRTFFLNSASRTLARAVQAGMVQRLRLSDGGVVHRDFAVLRSTWMPTILCEGAVIILPEHEAALRDPRFQAAYAKGIADGLEEFFRATGTNSGRGAQAPGARVAPGAGRRRKSGADRRKIL